MGKKSSNGGDIQLHIDDEYKNGYESSGEKINGLTNLVSGGSAAGTGKISENWDVDRYFFTTPKSGKLTIELTADKSSINIKAGNAHGSDDYFRSEGSTHHVQTFDVTAGGVVHLTIWDKDTHSAYNYNLKISFSAEGGEPSKDISIDIDDELINGYDSSGEEITGLNGLTSGGTATGSGKIAENWDVDRYFFTVPKSGEVTVDLAAEKNTINIKAGTSRGSESHFRSEGRTHHAQTFNASAGDVVHLTIWDKDTSAAYGYTLKICFSASCDSGGGGNSDKIWRPNLDFSQEDVYSSGIIVPVSTTSALNEAIQNAVPNTTILLKDGTYRDVTIKFPKGKHHITLKAVNNGRAVIIPKGRDDESAFRLANGDREDNAVHDINFIGLQIDGDGKALKEGGDFIKSVDGRYFSFDEDSRKISLNESDIKYGTHHIYLSDLYVHDTFMGIYSGLQSHDWTVENCKFENSHYSHFWYMMGWHHAVVNSKFIGSMHDGLAIRGYYPSGEVHTYIPEEIEACNEIDHRNTYVEDRGSRSVEHGFLPGNEWTHVIKNNEFKGVNPERDRVNSYIAVAYGIYEEDPICGAEKTYLPPQNIIITGNKFTNRAIDSTNGAINSAIRLAAWGGINSDQIASINGIKIVNNHFTRDQGEDFFIDEKDNGNIASVEDIPDSDRYGNE